MNDSHDERLNSLLGRWADAHRPSNEQLARLHASTLQELTSIKFLDLEADGLHSPRRWRIYAAVAAMAAALLAALGLPYMRRPAANEDGGFVIDNAAAKPGKAVDVPKPAAEEEVPAAARLEPQQLTRKAALIKVLRETFADDLLWVSETEGEIHVGLRSDPAPPGPEEGRPAELAIRVVLAGRRKNDRGWTTLCSADVLTEPEELVEVPLDTAPGGKLAVWTCLLPDGLVAVDADVRLNGPRGLHAWSSTVQREGVPCNADSSEQNGWEFRLYQTVERLPLNGVAPRRGEGVASPKASRSISARRRPADQVPVATEQFATYGSARAKVRRPS